MRNKLIIIVGVVLCLTLLLAGCINLPSDKCFEQMLYKNTSSGRYSDFNEVVFPSCTVQTSNDIEIVLSSIMDSIELVWYDVGDGTFISYAPGEPVNQLQNINPGEKYYIKVTQDVMLTIE